MKQVRVVITGLGVVSSVGLGWNAFWEALLNGRSGITEITSFDTKKFQTHKGGEVKKFDPSIYIDRSRIRIYNRASQFAIAATKMALNDSRLRSELLNRKRIGVAVGTTMAEAQAIESINQNWVEKGEGRFQSRLAAQYPASVISSHIGAEMGFEGPNVVIATACSAGNYAIAHAFDLLRLGKVDVMLAGGADAFSRIAFMGFNRLFAVAPERCQPFDKNRQGMMVGEGAGFLVIERLDYALNRGATIYSELLGYGLSCDASHMTIPNIDGVKRAITDALRDAKLSPNSIDYISAHGTGTPANDQNECAAIYDIFGLRAHDLPISSIKSMLGHTMGAASALEAIACALALSKHKIPPTINYETPDPDCDIDCVPNIGREWEGRYVLNNSFAFGGNNACLVLGQI